MPTLTSTRVIAAVVALVSASGCGPTSTSGQPAASISCGDFVARYRKVLASAPGTCRSDADCEVYGGFDPDKVCGGQTDLRTARALDAIKQEAAAARCPMPGYSCPAIRVRCDEGVCR